MTRRNQQIITLAFLGMVLIWIVLRSIFHGNSSTSAKNSAATASANSQSDPSAANGFSTDAPILPDEYSILQTRNAFGRGHGHGKKAGGPEAAFVFEGAVQASGRFTAFVENIPTKNIRQIAVGDSLARGRVKSIDLDAIEYTAAGKSLRIEVGQNLNGEAAPPPPPPASRPARPPAAPPNAPGPPPNGPPPGPMMNPG